MTIDTATDIDTDLRFILSNQAPSGAYPASPSYSQYPFCWLRDGSFIAHAMDQAGERESAARFHLWAARAVLGAEAHIRDLIAAKERTGPLADAAMPPARFTIAGAWEEDDWPNFQIDGYGQWLWSLERHAVHAGGLPHEVLGGAQVVADYLTAFWDEPCYDAWEEGRTQHHTSTLASACAGLRAAGELLGPEYREEADAAWAFIQERCIRDGHFVKQVGGDSVDASLLWLSTPFGLVEDGDPVFARTLELMESDLLADGGLMRYRADTFYGGGAWVLLTAWLAWHHARNGRGERAGELLDWVERQRGGNGSLPEQVATSRSDQWFLRYWTERWGESARPLLWSHAMALLARVEGADVSVEGTK